MSDQPQGSAAVRPLSRCLDCDAAIMSGAAEKPCSESGGSHRWDHGSAACTTIYCQKCKRATDDPAHKFGCDCACNRPTNRKVPILGPIPHDDENMA